MIIQVYYDSFSVHATTAADASIATVTVIAVALIMEVSGTCAPPFFVCNSSAYVSSHDT